MRILTLTKETQQNILENLLKRSPNSYGEYEGRVNAIIEEVRANRDAAVFSYTKKFDGADIDAGNISDRLNSGYNKHDKNRQNRAHIKDNFNRDDRRNADPARPCYLIPV